MQPGRGQRVPVQCRRARLQMKDRGPEEIPGRALSKITARSGSVTKFTPAAWILVKSGQIHRNPPNLAKNNRCRIVSKTTKNLANLPLFLSKTAP